MCAFLFCGHLITSWLRFEDDTFLKKVSDREGEGEGDYIIFMKNSIKTGVSLATKLIPDLTEFVKESACSKVVVWDLLSKTKYHPSTDIWR